MEVVRAPVLKLSCDCLLPTDFLAWVPGWIPISEMSLNPDRIKCWVAKMVNRLGCVIHPFGIPGVPRGHAIMFISIKCYKRLYITNHNKV